MMRWIERLMGRLGWRRAEARTFTLAAELAEWLEGAAEEAQVTTQEMAEALLAEALEQRQINADSWRRWHKLTRREKEVTRLLYQQYNFREVAARLDIAPDTAKVHVHNILLKFGLHSKAELNERLSALEALGLLTDDD
jgi:DNA-binding CsgD family transcriptional regulator